MTETAELFGKVIGLEVKDTGWTQFNVQVEGDKYPVPVSTKIDDIIAQGKEALTWPFAHVRYTPSTNINEKTGKPYRGGRAAAFLPATPADVEKAQAASVDGVGSRGPQKDLTIVRESALKTAFGFGAYAFAGAKEEGERARLEIYLMALAGRLEGWILRPSSLAVEPPAGNAEGSDFTAEDEDIPF